MANVHLRVSPDEMQLQGSKSRSGRPKKAGTVCMKQRMLPGAIGKETRRITGTGFWKKPGRRFLPYWAGLRNIRSDCCRWRVFIQRRRQKQPGWYRLCRMTRYSKVKERQVGADGKDNGHTRYDV